MRKRTKFAILRVVVLLAFGILAGRVWYVQVVMGSYYRSQANTSKIRTIPVQARRGIIYDDVGRQLVWNAPSWNITVVPNGVPDGRARAIYGTLSRLLGGSPSARQLATAVRKNRWAPYRAVVVKRDVSTWTATVVIQYHNRLPGVRAELTSVRRYRADGGRNSLAHILGYAGLIDAATYAADRKLYPGERIGLNDQVGKTGVELQFDPYLHGINGNEQVEVDAGERPVRTLRRVRTVPGDSLYLTLDWKLQQKVSRDLAAALKQIGLRRGVAILEDVRTGAIKAMVSLPSYDSNAFSHVVTLRQYRALTQDPARPLTDLATQGQFPPGSIFKLITATAALQSGVVNGSTIVNDTGRISIPCAFRKGICQTFTGWMPPPGLGPMNIVSALAQSSDIYFWTVAGGNPTLGKLPYVGADRLAYYARLLGLGKPTGIELPNEAAGLVPSRSWFNRLPQDGILRAPGSEWHIGDTYNMAIGQGFNEVTPLQMVNATAAIANNGTLYRPRIVSRIRGRVVPNVRPFRRTRTIQPFVPSIVRRGFLNPETIALIQRGMHQSVQPFPAGTSYMAIDSRIDPAGKTGTAEDHPEGQPNVAAADAWWVGYAPYSRPRIAVVVLVPNASSEGAFTAAPIALKLMQDYFNLPPRTPNWVSTVTRSLAGTGGH